MSVLTKEELEEILPYGIYDKAAMTDFGVQVAALVEERLKEKVCSICGARAEPSIDLIRDWQHTDRKVDHSGGGLSPRPVRGRDRGGR